jgi:Fur family ferric uptake transcriptional regulator
LRHALRATGLRVTPARLRVLAELSGATTPQSHADVVATLADGPWDRATLYRNLLDLVRAGLARRVDLGDHVWRFEVQAAHHDPEAHPHFLCTSCGSSQCLPAIAFDPPPAAPASLRAHRVEVQIKGVCDACL